MSPSPSPELSPGWNLGLSTEPGVEPSIELEAGVESGPEPGLYLLSRQYISFIGLLHKESELTNPLIDNYFITLLLRGIKRVKGNSWTQKRPITINILVRIRKLLNYRSSFHSSFWAICLTAFLECFINL